MQAVILAAGRGSRLHPITENRTKAMAPILGKPIVERVMDPLVVNGVRDFVLVISPEDEEIRTYFQDHSQIDAEVVLVPQPEPMGMGHALLQAAPYIHDDFVLSSCDNLVPEDDVKRVVHAWDGEPGLNGVLSLLRVGPANLTRMGVVKMEADLVVQIVEKPSLEEAPSDIASVPLYCFRQRLLDYLPEVKPSRRGEIELQDAIQTLICQDGNVRGVHVSSRMDLTKPEDLLRINQHYLTNGFSTGPVSDREPGKDTQIVPPVYYERNVHIGEHCQLGPNVYIEHSSTIGDHVTLRNAVVLRERQVFSGAEISGQVIF